MPGTTRPAGAACGRTSSRKSRYAVSASLEVRGVLSARQLRTMSSLIVATLSSFGTRATCKASASPATPAPSKRRKTSGRKSGLTAGQLKMARKQAAECHLCQDTLRKHAPSVLRLNANGHVGVA